MTKFVPIDTEHLGVQFINPAQVRRVHQHPQNGERAIITFSTDDLVVAVGSAEDVTRRLMS